ncbi:MAG: hypothetical protein Q7S19_02710 [bacterium]|nr:hypothetical protein [bacterium]
MMKERFYKTQDQSDKGVEVEIVKKEELGRGEFGVASSVAIEAGKHKFPFVLKEYKSEVSAKDELQKYLDAKEAGLKVFPTFRISEDGKKAIMTTGHTPEWVCIGSNNENVGGSLESLGLAKIKSIEEKSFDDFLKNFFEQAVVASKDKFSLPYDAPFFFTQRNATENVKIDFVLGDLGQVGKNLSGDDDKRRNMKNVKSLKVALNDFIKRNLEDPRIYMGKINEAARVVDEMLKADTENKLVY